MALTITTVKEGILGDLRYKVLTLAFDSSYPTGGESFTASDVGMDFFHLVECNSDDGYVFKWDKANAKILAYYADYDAGADGALIQAANTLDLSATINVETFVIGI